MGNGTEEEEKKRKICEYFMLSLFNQPALSTHVMAEPSETGRTGVGTWEYGEGGGETKTF